jgi:hypothetical protein
MPAGGINRVEIAVCSIPALLAMKGHAPLRRGDPGTRRSHSRPMATGRFRPDGCVASRAGSKKLAR